MPLEPRLSDKELHAINVAAVTREHRVDPRLGMSRSQNTCGFVLNVVVLETIVPCLQLTGE
jgi:hypothetical protein